MGQWYTQGETREAALTRKVPPDAAAIRDLLLLRRSRFDDEHHVGYSLGLWNGREDGESIRFSFHAGGGNLSIANTCNLDLSVYKGDAPERLLRVPTLIEVLRCLVRCCTPDWGVVNSFQFLAHSPTLANNAPKIGWLTYLSRERGEIPTLPAPSRSVLLDQAGTVIITVDERFAANNPIHIDTAALVQHLLDQAGLLNPFR